MGEETGEYQMYEMLQDESIEEGNIVWVAKPIETQSSIKPENNGYTRVVENGQDAKFNEVIIHLEKLICQCIIEQLTERIMGYTQ